MHACKTGRSCDPLEMATINQTCCSMRFKQQTILMSTISFKLGMMHNLTAMLIKKVCEERVTEPNTVARQLALAKAKGHGGRFHVTNEAHMTCDVMFIAVEMSVRCDERAEDEKKKKLAIQCQEVEDKALAILQQERSVQSLNVKELDVFLAWHQAPKVSGAKKADKLV